MAYIVDTREIDSQIEMRRFAIDEFAERQRSGGLQKQKTPFKHRLITIFVTDPGNSALHWTAVIDSSMDGIQFFISHEPNVNGSVIGEKYLSYLLNINPAFSDSRHLRHLQKF